VNVVDNQKRGSYVGDQIFDALRRRVQKYETFLNSNLDDFSSHSQDISTFDKISTSQDVGTPDHSSIIRTNIMRISSFNLYRGESPKNNIKS